MNFGRSKYKSERVEIDGIKFDSRKEGRHYLELKLRERAGEITDLQVHPKYDLVVNGCKICRYEPDFEYYDVIAGETVSVDVKGYRRGAAWATFRVKSKLFTALYGREVLIV